MIGFRFSLVLDFGLGTANPRATQPSRPSRLECARRTSAANAAHPGPLGRGPLEPEDFCGRTNDEKLGREMPW